MWNGWRRDAPTERQVAYRLKQMKTAALLAGDTVHRVIRELLIGYRDEHIEWTRTLALYRARELWHSQLAESRSKQWIKYPKDVTCLFEDYYQVPERDERVAAAWDCVESCIDNFFTSRTWEHLLKSRPERWLALDSFNFDESTVDIDGTPCCMVIDLGYDLSFAVAPRQKCRIFDWKTGRRRPQDEDQVAFYALFAAARWGFRSEQVTGRLVYLRDGTDHDVVIDEEMLGSAKENIQQSYARMQSLVADLKSNEPLPIEHFPVTEHASYCRSCKFQEICLDRLKAIDA
jgi:CRISPR/Cas system-associated exonuclease Cas4 (RecB family)